MNNFVQNLCCRVAITPFISRSFSITSSRNEIYKCRLLVIGGGTGGCTMASKFVKKMAKDSVIVLEPKWQHYYQPLFTLVGAGAASLESSRRLEESVLPQGVKWIRDAADGVNPDECVVTTKSGHSIHYEYLIIAAGLINDYHTIPGLYESLGDTNSGVSTIYAPEYVEKTWANLQQFESGEAVFTYPDSPIKCPGAPQKIAYLTESYLTKVGRRSKANIIYNTSTPQIFGVKKYADALVKVAERKKIKVNCKTVLKEIYPDRKEALFINKEDPNKNFTLKYSLLHVTPPMRTPQFLHANKKLSDNAGFLDVDKYTLQHKRYCNIFGIGDCTNTPNSKTAAAIAKQCYVLERNLRMLWSNEGLDAKYDGYGGCPLVTSYGTCITAEFLYDGVVHETLPFNQAKESKLAYYMKKNLFPFIYWNFMLKGWYHGPEFVRKIVNPFGW